MVSILPKPGTEPGKVLKKFFFRILKKKRVDKLAQCWQCELNGTVKAAFPLKSLVSKVRHKPGTMPVTICR